MKRETVSKMLTNRLADAKRAIKSGREIDEMVNILGGSEMQPEYYTTIQRDIEQLEYLINCLKELKSRK